MPHSAATAVHALLATKATTALPIQMSAPVALAQTEPHALSLQMATCEWGRIDAIALLDLQTVFANTTSFQIMSQSALYLTVQ
jgi:hypothetical protein